jgi:predicted RNA polymerase sigma factor
VLLLEQDRSRWDWMLIRRGLAAIDRAGRLTETPGPYLLQAQIAACHARAHTAEATDWAKIAGLYSQLANLTRSPVVEIGRAVAVSMAEGPAAGLEILDSLDAAGALRDYHRLPSVRADLLFKLERHAEALAEFRRAAELAENQQERRLLLDRARECEARLARDGDPDCV